MSSPVDTPRARSDRAERIRHLHREGWSLGEIAKDVGMTRAAVSGVIFRLVGRKSQTIADREGLTISDPYRADRLLRRFSWEAQP